MRVHITASRYHNAMWGIRVRMWVSQGDVHVMRGGCVQTAFDVDVERKSLSECVINMTAARVEKRAAQCPCTTCQTPGVRHLRHCHRARCAENPPG